MKEAGERLSYRSVEVHVTMLKGIMGDGSLPLFDQSSHCFGANEGETMSTGFHDFYVNSPETP